MLAGTQQTVRSKGDNVMFTLRTLTTVGLILVLATGASAADKKGRSGNSHAKAKVQSGNKHAKTKVQRPNQSKAAHGGGRVGGKMHLDDAVRGVMGHTAARKSGSRKVEIHGTATLDDGAEQIARKSRSRAGTGNWGANLSLGEQTARKPLSVAVGDINNDGDDLATSKFGPRTGPQRATDAEIIKALNDRTQLRSMGQPAFGSPTARNVALENYQVTSAVHPKDHSNE